MIKKFLKLFGIFLLIFLSYNIHSLDGWNYYRPILINNTQNPNSLTNYSILITLNTQSLISEGKMRPDCGDIRFTDSNSTLLNYWIMPNTCNTNNTLIWVNILYIPGNSTKTIYLWYGNLNATSMSNFNATFPNSYILTSGSATLGGNLSYNFFGVGPDATLYVQRGVILNITANYIYIAGTINGNGAGYPGQKSSPGPGYGPGAGQYGGYNGGGAGYGGAGGCAPANGAGSCSAPGGATYGTYNGFDIDMGSGGAMGADGNGNAGGNGGGAVILQGEYIQIAGTISCNGENGQASSSYSYGGGGGSGGGILIMGNYLNLSGAVLEAKGGKAGNKYGASGGGGRIKIFYSSLLTGTYTTNVSALNASTYGDGLLLSSAIGQPGTVYVGTFTYLGPTVTIGPEYIALTSIISVNTSTNFQFNVSIYDPISEYVNYTVYLNGSVLTTNNVSVTAGQTLTIPYEFLYLLNQSGTYNLTVTAYGQTSKVTVITTKIFTIQLDQILNVSLQPYYTYNNINYTNLYNSNLNINYYCMRSNNTLVIYDNVTNKTLQFNLSCNYIQTINNLFVNLTPILQNNTLNYING